MAASPQEFVAWCRSQVGVRWEHQGRSPRVERDDDWKRHAHLDCVGLPVCACLALALPVVDMKSYSEIVEPAQLIAHVAKNCVRVAEPQPGALVVLWIRRPAMAQHVGIWSGEGTLIHAQRWRGGGHVAEEQLSEMWGDRVHSCWMHPAWMEAA